MEGTCDALVTTIRPKKNPIRIGIDIGGTDTKIGLVDEQNQLIATDVMPTGADRPAGEVIVDIARRTLDFLETQNIDLDQCLEPASAYPERGFPERRGAVFQQHPLDHVEIVKEMERVLPIPCALQ